MTDRLNARIAIPLLAVVGALSGCGGGDTGNTTAAPAPAQTAAATCATPPQAFTATVWPSMAARAWSATVQARSPAERGSYSQPAAQRR